MSQKQSYHLELPNFAQKITTVISILNIPILQVILQNYFLR